MRSPSPQSGEGLRIMILKTLYGEVIRHRLWYRPFAKGDFA